MLVSEKMMDDAFKMPKTELTNFIVIFESVTELIAESKEGERGTWMHFPKDRP